MDISINLWFQIAIALFLLAHRRGIFLNSCKEIKTHAVRCHSQAQAAWLCRIAHRKL